jgi:hypothetical protein
MAVQQRRSISMRRDGVLPLGETTLPGRPAAGAAAGAAVAAGGWAFFFPNNLDTKLMIYLQASAKN